MHVHTLSTRNNARAKYTCGHNIKKNTTKAVCFIRLLQSSTSEFWLKNLYLLVLNMDTQSTSRRALKSPQEQEDWRHSRNESGRAQPAAETANKWVKGWESSGRVIVPCRHAAQTASERRATLKRKSTFERERMASETPKEREWGYSG